MRKRNFIAAAMLSAALSCGFVATAQASTVWDGSSDTSWYNASYTSFTLSTAEQVSGFAQIASGTAEGIAKDTFQGKTVVLGDDIDLNSASSDRDWVPIADVNGSAPTSTYFDGTFDGNGHVIRQLKINGSRAVPNNYGGYQGFFGALGENAIIKNLGIESGSVSGRVVGGIAAVSHTSNSEVIPQIIGCFNKATVVGNGSSSRGTGGIFGGEDQIGEHEDTSSDAYRAAAYIADSYNMGNVTSSGPAGGIAGTGSIKLFACYNTGMVAPSRSGGTYHASLVGNLFMKGKETAAGFDSAGTVKNSYAYIGTDEHLYRIIDATHTIDNPAYPTTTWAQPYYNGSADFLGAEFMELAADRLGTAFINDDSTNPVNDRMPLLWWQAGKSQIDMSLASIAPISTQLFTGGPITPSLDVYVPDSDGGYESVLLNEGSDYRVVYRNNLEVGIATVQVYGIGRYNGLASATTFQIVQIDLSQCTIDSISPQWFYGEAIRPQITVRANADAELREGVDYTVSYSGNDKPGVATVRIAASGPAATGENTANFYLVEASSSLEGNGTQDDPYLLKSKADMQFFSHMINTGEEGWYSAHYKLANDIDARAADENDLGIDTIGVGSNGFAGVFDGDGHVLTVGLDSAKLSPSLRFSPGWSAFALFSSTNSAHETVIENLILDGSLTSVGSVGGFVGSSSDEHLIIRNCTNRATVTCAGGILTASAGFVCLVAEDTYATFENCVNEGTISGGSASAGIAVQVRGASNPTTFTNCSNKGSVTSTESAGGIVQEYQPSSRSKLSFENCFNEGNVRSTRGDGGAAGGILGMIQDGSANNEKVVFTSCYNSGNVTGGRHAGGINGQVYYTPMVFTGCYNTGTVTDNSGWFGGGGIIGATAYESDGWTLNSCYNVGKTRGVDPGALVGYCFAGSTINLNNCYYLDSSASNAVGRTNVAQGLQVPVTISGEAVAKTGEEMKKTGAGGMASLLGSIFVDDIDANLNNGYPVCYWQLNFEKNDILNATVADIPDQFYTAGPVSVELDVTFDGMKLVEGADYELSYENNVEIGTATVIIRGIGRYSGERTKTFQIAGSDISKCTIDEIPAQWSTDSGATPDIVVTNPAGNVLKRGVDYEVEFKDNLETGTATVVVTGIDRYSGSISATFSVVQASKALEGSGTKSDPYLISSIADMSFMVTKVNSGEGKYPFSYYQLQADLDVAPSNDRPAIASIGNNAHHFRGSFNGNGHTVNIGIDATDIYQGLFGVVSSATIKNLTVTGYVKQQVERLNAGQETLGAAAGFIGYSFDELTMVNCVNKAAVTSNGAVVAGLVALLDADNSRATIKDCRNEGAISSGYYLAAGLVADCRGTEITVKGSSNVGEVSASYMACGLVGRPGGSTSRKTALNVSNSFNTGAVTGQYRSGGLVGSIYSFADVKLSNVFNTGQIECKSSYISEYLSDGTAAIGGLAGNVGSRASLVVANAYNAGKLVSADSGLALAAAVGSVNSAATSVDIDNFYYCEGKSAVGIDSSESVDTSKAKLVGSSQLMEENTVSALGSAFGMDVLGVNAGYPVLDQLKMDLEDCGLSPVADQVYTGDKIVPAVGLFNSQYGISLLAGRDYELVASDNLNAGTAILRIIGTGAYKGEIVTTFEIAKDDLASCSVEPVAKQPETGDKVAPELIITNAIGKQLIEGVDYTVDFTNNVKPGTARYVATGIGNYEGTVSGRFDIFAQTSIEGKVEISAIADQDYTGQAIEPEVTVVMDGIVMLEGDEYTVFYENNIEPGVATVVVCGAGQFKGEVRASFNILKAHDLDPVDISKADVAAIEDVTYTGAAHKPKPRVSLDDKVLELDKDYVLSYANNIDAGTASVLIEGIGAYTGSIKATFTIRSLGVNVIVEPTEDGASDSGAKLVDSDKASKKVTTATINKKKVTAKVVAKAIGNNKSTVSKVILGKKVKTVSKKAFAKFKKVKTIVVKSSKLKTRKSVQNCFKGSKVKNVKISLSSSSKKKVKKAFKNKKWVGKRVAVK